MAISWVADAVLGDGIAMEIIYTITQYTKLKKGETFLPKSYIVPCNLACAKIPKIGITTAVIINPIVTQNQSSPELYPNNGGNNKFPAPKNMENKAKPVIRTSLVLFILKYIAPRR